MNGVDLTCATFHELMLWLRNRSLIMRIRYNPILLENIHSEPKISSLVFLEVLALKTFPYHLNLVRQIINLFHFQSYEDVLLVLYLYYIYHFYNLLITFLAISKYFFISVLLPPILK